MHLKKRKFLIYLFLTLSACGSDGRKNGSDSDNKGPSDSNNKGPNDSNTNENPNAAKTLEYDSYTTTVGQVEMKVMAPKSATKTLQLAVYLHSDTAKDYTNDRNIEKYKTFAREKGLLFVAALSPNANSWWSPGDYATWAFYDKHLDAALTALHEKYNIDKQSYLFAGASGGSAFLTSVFVPAFGNKYPGTYVINCGGNRINVRGSVKSLNTDKLKMYFYYGDRDWLIPNINYAITGYKALGITIEKEVIPNMQHCAYPVPEQTFKAWSQNVIAL